MPKLRVHAFSISLDGYGAGPNQDRQHGLGVGGEDLHRWFFPTSTFREMQKPGAGGTTGVDDQFAARGFENIGATIMGRNMFGPIRGRWQDDEWKGWWGSNPPYHTPVYVLTHHPRPPLPMAGGTEFRFVNEPIEIVLQQAFEAAHGKDVRLGGGVSTVRQYLQAQLVDEMHLAISPTFLGSGEHLLTGLDLPKLGYACAEHVTTEAATHVVVTKRA